MLLLPPGSAIGAGPQDVTALLLPDHYANLPQRALLARARSIGGPL